VGSGRNVEERGGRKTGETWTQKSKSPGNGPEKPARKENRVRTGRTHDREAGGGKAHEITVSAQKREQPKEGTVKAKGRGEVVGLPVIWAINRPPLSKEEGRSGWSKN